VGGFAADAVIACSKIIAHENGAVIAHRVGTMYPPYWPELT